ncbi:MAG: outer membrane beta-barrel protein [Acidobacteria bacterium]|nr:outer membrane beta-barrel protein [Acidobacteriota bacterium]
MKKIGFTLCCAALLVWASSVAMAQTASPLSEPKGSLPVNSSEGINLGPFLFSPAFDLTWESRDNVFFTPDNPVSDDMIVARAKLMFELPVNQSYLRLSYVPLYRNYQTIDLKNKWSHFVDLDGNFIFANGLKLDALYRFVSANLDTREVDPGGELVYGDQQFDKHFFQLRMDYWISPTNGISFRGSYETISYDARDRGSFYDYDKTRLGAGWIHQISPTLTGGLIYNHEEFNPKDTFGYRQSSSDEIVASFDGQITPVWASRIEVGWRSTSYNKVEGLPKPSDASGLVIRGDLDWTLAHGSVLRLDLIRQDFPSNYQFQSHYVAAGAGLLYKLQLNRFFAHARLRYQNNDYSQPDVVTGQDRSDDITTYGLGVGYRLSSIFSLRGTFTHQKRDSLHPYSYTANVFLIGLTVGF